MAEYDFNWTVIWQYQKLLLAALWTSAQLAAASMVLGGVLGLALAYLSTSRMRIVRTIATAYVSVVRNTPLLLFVFILYLVVPQFGLRGLDAAASFVVALSIVSGGYICEDLRGALSSIPRTYIDAAKGIGLNALQRQLFVVLPLVLRYALPALTNSAVAIFKDTSLASVIAVQELTFVARAISTNYFRVFEAWTAVAALYLIGSSSIAALSRLIERRLPGAS